MTCSILLLMGLVWTLATKVSAHPRLPQSSSANSVPAPLSGFTDGGLFHRYLNGERVGSISFRWFDDGRIENSMSITRGRQTITATTKIESDRDGSWTRIEILSPQGTTTILREGSTARISSGKTVTLEPNSVLFGPYAPELMSQPIRLYDAAKGGRQTFSLFLFSAGRNSEATLELKDRTRIRMEGAEREFTRFIYRLPRLVFVVWTDASGKVYYAENAEEHGAFVRAGYEALLQANVS